MTDQLIIQRVHEELNKKSVSAYVLSKVLNISLTSMTNAISRMTDIAEDDHGQLSIVNYNIKHKNVVLV